MPQSYSPSPSTPQTPAFRFAPVVHLQTGETANLYVETERRFEDRAVFGPRAQALFGAIEEDRSPAVWLSQHLETVANEAHERTIERPVIVSAPLASLIHPDTAMLCDAAISRTRLCPQEICLEVSDAALALPSKAAQTGIEALRRCGFRVSVDLTRSWTAPLGSSLRLLLDSLRIDARRLNEAPELNKRVEAANASGMYVIAENAPWRDGDYLASLGVDYGIRPRADA
ncbi:MAG: EAL domain-containing protein [Henriciella sp.]|nr:EAL domain-containing protein [Henriciella sp.]